MAQQLPPDPEHQLLSSWWDEAYSSGEFLRHWDCRYPSQELVALVAAGIVPAGGTTLDIGCGGGREAVFLARCGYRSIGVDLSGEGLAIARQRAQQAGVAVDFRLGSALSLPLEDACVDFANDRGCFHHIADDLRLQYADEAARVLKHGSKLLLRGCRETGDETFVLVTEEAIQRYFLPGQWSAGRVLPLTLASDAGSLEANVVVLERL